ncbi:unnamed protein product [Boreogadus saida]
MNHDKEEKGIVAGQRLGTSASGGRPSAGLKRETFAANNPFLLHVVVHVLEGVKAKSTEPHAAGCPLPGDGASRQPGGMSQFMYFSESKPKFLSPQFLLNHGSDNSHNSGHFTAGSCEVPMQVNGTLKRPV